MPSGMQTRLSSSRDPSIQRDYAGSGLELTKVRVLDIACILYLASTPWERFTLFGQITPVQITGVLYLSTYIVTSLVGRRRKDRNSGAALAQFAILLVAVWSALTSAWSVQQDSSIATSISIVFLALSSFAIGSSSSRQLPAMLASLTFGCTSLALLQLTNQFAGLKIGPLIDPNITAFNLCIGFAAALYLFSTSGRVLIRFIAAISTGVIVVGVLIQGSRTGLGGLVGITLLSIILASSIKRRVLLGAGAALGAALFIWLETLGALPARLTTFLNNPNLDDPYLQSRSSIIDAFRELQPIWEIKGIGVGADADFLALASGWYRNAHSLFWKVWIETGFVGLALWVIMLAAIARAALNSPARLFLIISLGYVVPFMYDLGPAQANTLWVLIGLALMARPLHDVAAESVKG